jgi:hypothetical protein
MKQVPIQTATVGGQNLVIVERGSVNRFPYVELIARVANPVGPGSSATAMAGYHAVRACA